MKRDLECTSLGMDRSKHVRFPTAAPFDMLCAPGDVEWLGKQSSSGAEMRLSSGMDHEVVQELVAAGIRRRRSGSSAVSI